MAAGGQTNREIAQALFVTPKTVEVHLSNAVPQARHPVETRAPLGAQRRLMRAAALAARPAS